MKYSLFLALAATTVSIAAPLAAQVTNDASAITAGTYAVEPNHTLVQFSVNHFGFNDFFGTFPRASGTLSFNPKAVAATKLDVSVPVAGVSTTNPTLDGELKSADWFDAATYPTIRFVSSHVEKTGANTARISGTITLHGVSKPMVLDATFGGAGVNPMSKAYTAGFKATGHIKRTEFGVSKYAPMVSDDVTLTITAAFEKAK